MKELILLIMQKRKIWLITWENTEWDQRCEKMQAGLDPHSLPGTVDEDRLFV